MDEVRVGEEAVAQSSWQTIALVGRLACLRRGVSPLATLGLLEKCLVHVRWLDWLRVCTTTPRKVQRRLRCQHFFVVAFALRTTARSCAGERRREHRRQRARAGRAFQLTVLLSLLLLVFCLGRHPSALFFLRALSRLFGFRSRLHLQPDLDGVEEAIAVVLAGVGGDVAGRLAFVIQRPDVSGAVFHQPPQETNVSELRRHMQRSVSTVVCSVQVGAARNRRKLRQLIGTVARPADRC